MIDKNVIITGANSGIGKAAAFRFANEGYRLIMACRNIDSSKHIQNEIINTTKNENVDLLQLDTSSFKSIKSFVETCKQKYQKLDILINNAAYFEHGSKFKLSDDDIELTFATNVLGPYLLTTLLIDLLKKSSDARVLNCGSNIIKHFFNPKKKINFDRIKSNKSSDSFTVYESYRDSKMALLMLTFKMADEFKQHNIKVNSLQINGAKMSKETLNKFTLKWKIIAAIQNLFFPPADFMADKYFEICTSDKYRNITGKLINHKLDIMEPAKNNKSNSEFAKVLGSKYYPDYAEEVELIEIIWNLCKEYTGV